MQYPQIPVTINNSKLDKSGTITLGGTAQPLMAANPARKGIQIYNVSGGDLWFSEVGTASAGSGSIKIASGGYFASPVGGVTLGAISIYGATTSQAFTAWQY